MKISELVTMLENCKKDNGDIEVTCTAAVPDSPRDMMSPAVYESTVSSLRVLNEQNSPSRSGRLGVRVRLYW